MEFFWKILSFRGKESKGKKNEKAKIEKDKIVMIRE
jgi:hypothetical protein